MGRIDEVYAILSGRSTEGLIGHHPGDSLLRSLVAHVIWADGRVVSAEFDAIQLLFPDLSPGELMVWLETESGNVLDIEALLAQFPSPDDRRALVAVARMTGRLDSTEALLEEALVEALSAAILP